MDPEGDEQRPAVPPDSWYGQPFEEDSPMPLTKFHANNKCRIHFALDPISTNPSVLGEGQPPTVDTFVLGESSIYGLGYLANTALSVEHYWRLRVQQVQRTEQPDFDLLIGIRVSIDGQLIPDRVPHQESLDGCTTTLRAHEPVQLWRAVPIPLCPRPEDRRYGTPSLFSSLIFSFLAAASVASAGEHKVDVEVVYGSKSESFCSDFVSRGSFSLVTYTASADNVAVRLAQAQGHSEIMTASVMPHSVRLPTNFGVCPHCGAPRAYSCTTCGAVVCGSRSCVWRAVPEAYPLSCRSHRPAEN